MKIAFSRRRASVSEMIFKAYLGKSKSSYRRKQETKQEKPSLREKAELTKK